MQRSEKSLYASASEENILSTLFLANTIQQNLQIEGQYMREIDQYKSEIERAEQRIRELRTIIRELADEIKALEDRKGLVQGLQILREPTKRHKPIRPRIQFNVVLSAMMGLFFTTLAAFLIEALHAGKGKQRT